MKYVRSTLRVLAFLAMATPPVAAQSFPSDADIRAMLQERVDLGGTVGIAVGLLEADGSTRIVVAGSAGEGALPLSGRTVFEIGSITKVFTGALLALMARSGEVSLDDPVERYLPDGVTMPSGDGREITLVDLATHYSGLPRLPANMAPVDPADPYADYTAELLYAFLSSYELRRPIGIEFEYSNLGVGLLGHVLALRAGTSYEALVRDRIIRPLGMASTGITLSPPMAEQMARGHDLSGVIVPLWDVGVLAGAGGLRSNVEDMLLFMAANVGEPHTDLEQALRDAHAPQARSGANDEIGLNWITRTTDGQRTVWHNGGTAGFRTFAGFDPDAGTAVVVLTNSGIGADDIGLHLLNPEVPLAPPTLPANVRRPAVRIDPAILERYVGQYELGPGVVATFDAENGQLFTQLTGQSRLPMFAASETVFFLRVVDAEVEFEVDADGVATGIVLRQNGRETRASRIR